MEYNVTWGDGTLGLTLRPDLGEDMPPVVGRITRDDSAAALAGVAVGHMLVSVNGIETARRGYASIVHMLKTIPRPCTLRFRIPKSLVPNRHSDGGTISRDQPSRRGLERQRTMAVDGSDSAMQYYQRSDSQQLHRQGSTHERTSQHSDRGSSHRGSGGSSSRHSHLPPTNGSFNSTTSSIPEVVYAPPPPAPVDVPVAAPPPSSSSGRPKKETYTVEWLEGPLGMIFRPDDLDCHIPCIRKITGKGLGTRGIDRARVGDILLDINGTSTKAIGFRASISTLKSLDKPAILKFKRMRRRVSSRRREDPNGTTTPAPVVVQDAAPAPPVSAP
ncbi:hypothetical protein As57867_009082, partial [Aphanomyces stellatus]